MSRSKPDPLPRRQPRDDRGPHCPCGEPLDVHTDDNGNLLETCNRCGTKPVVRWLPNETDPPDTARHKRKKK